MYAVTTFIEWTLILLLTVSRACPLIPNFCFPIAFEMERDQGKESLFSECCLLQGDGKYYNTYPNSDSSQIPEIH